MARPGTYLAIGGGVTIETAAVSLTMPEVSLATVAVLAVVAIGCAAPIGRALGPPGARQEPDSLAVECRRLQRALQEFVEARRRARPSPRPVIAALQFWRPSEEAWAEETERRYQRDLKDWATRVYDRLERDSVVTSGSRPSVEWPRADQITHLPELFANAARSLE